MQKEWKIILKHYESLLAIIREIEKLLEDFFNSEAKECEWLLPAEEENRCKLFKEIQKLEHFNRRKNQRICQEYSNRLLKLFVKFPNEHKVIKKSLNI